MIWKGLKVVSLLCAVIALVGAILLLVNLNGFRSGLRSRLSGAQGLGTIATARAKQEAKNAFDARASSVGIICSILGGQYVCSKIIARAEKNPRLKDALLQARAEGISVFAEAWPWFSAGSVSDRGWIDINILASDEKIVAFLTK